MTNLWESYRDQASVSVVSALYSSSEKGKEKELDIFNQIAQDLEKYTQPTSQDEFQDYYSRELYNIGKITALE